MGTAVLLGLRAGLLMSALATLLTVLAFPLARDFLLDEYPPAVRRRYGPQSKRGRWVSGLVGLALTISYFLLMLWSTASMHAVIGGHVGFASTFVIALVTIVTVDVVEFVLIFWLLIARWRPSFVVLPGTADMTDYRSVRFRFHPDNLLRSTILLLMVALIAAWLLS